MEIKGSGEFMKYYYKDALAAAWMADKYGMAFQSASRGDYPYMGMEKGNIYDVNPLHNMQESYRMNNLFVEHYYIHPDSLSILEPQVGDLISINNGESASIVTHQEFLEQIESMKHQFSSPLKIIQRNNTVFMWPEKESE